MASETAIGEANCLGWAARDPSGFLSPYKLDRRHEIAGIVHDVKRFKIGDHVAVRTYVNSCQRYTYKIPDNYPLELAAPLLCAGIIVYAPMKRHNMNQPDEFVLSLDEQQMKALANSLDFIIDTASRDHPFDLYLNLLKVAGVCALVGDPNEVKFRPISLLIGMRTMAGSETDGTKETQQMLDFCAAKGVYPKVEVILIDYVNEALERLIKRDVKYRFVIDVENSLKV
ncbi:putative cinnamyl alcohol dehydrogenase 1 [Drosera capensis]